LNSVSATLPCRASFEASFVASRVDVLRASCSVGQILYSWVMVMAVAMAVAIGLALEMGFALASPFQSSSQPSVCRKHFGNDVRVSCAYLV
jgi:hypothetical protein